MGIKYEHRLTLYGSCNNSQKVIKQQGILTSDWFFLRSELPVSLQ